MNSIKSNFSISMQALRRLPIYYSYIKTLQENGVDTISAPTIAKEMNMTDVQVRKDLAAVSTSGGRPRTGFGVMELLHDIEVYLGYDNINDAVLVGAGQLGRALLSYQGFERNGVRIVAAFDSDPTFSESIFGGKQIFPMDKLPDLCRRMSIHIGIITVPDRAAQQVCDMLVNNGIQAIWNFAPVHLSVPKGVLVQNENMAISLALLSLHLAEKSKVTLQKMEERP